MAQAPRYFQQPEGIEGREGEGGEKGTPGSDAKWRLYIMGDHPNAIPGETYSDPSIGDGWLAMGDAYLSQQTGGVVNGPTAFGSTVSVTEPSAPEHAATKAYVDAGNGATAVAEHEAELDPHPQYSTDADLAAKENTGVAVSLVTAHEAKADPHPVYLTQTEGDARYSAAGGGSGSTILSGTATPDGGTGNVGDYYLDTDDRVLYGPKTAASAPPPESMIGATPTNNGNPSGPSPRTWGIRFQALAAGTITHIRFWRDPAAIQTSRSLTLWSDAGTNLGTVATSGESGSGWKSAALPAPVAITAGTFYRASFDQVANTFEVYTPLAPVSASPNFGTLQNYYTTAANSFPTTANPGINLFADIVYQPSAASPWPVALRSVPPGGTTGQYLKKTSNADYAVGWVT